MSIFRGDVDIDVVDRDDILSGLSHVSASMVKDGQLVKHNVGVYFQGIPSDPVTGLANLEYHVAEDVGYQKIDLLNNSVYQSVVSEDHLQKLVDMEPIWELLEYEEVVVRLFHIGKYAHLVNRLKPKSIEDLAMILAIIRPAKAYLQNCGWDAIRREVWNSDGVGGYVFKRSHSISYAMVIVVQLNQLAFLDEGDLSPFAPLLQDVV